MVYPIGSLAGNVFTSPIIYRKEVNTGFNYKLYI